jgi:hypothetical protein
MQAYLDAEKASCPVHRGFASAGDWQLPAARRMPQVRLSRFGGDPPGAPFLVGGQMGPIERFEHFWISRWGPIGGGLRCGFALSALLSIAFALIVGFFRV